MVQGRPRSQVDPAGGCAEELPVRDQIGEALVFDIAWNNLRLITTVEYPTKRIFVKALMSHKEYDRKEWMKWAKR